MYDPNHLSRRDFLTSVAAGSASLVAAAGCNKSGKQQLASRQDITSVALDLEPEGPKRPYDGPNVVIIRFGGGARRLETINPDRTYSPFLCHEFAPQGTLFPNMEIDSLVGVETSHGQGTLYIVTGKYDRFQDVGGKFLGARFEAKVPTVFEYLRKTYDIPEHQALIINGEDRTDEEFYTFSNHHLFGANFRSNVLSLYRFKVHLLRRQIENGEFADDELIKKQAELAKLEALDYRRNDDAKRSAEIEKFWERWHRYYGASGLVNPRGDSVLTELAIRSIRELRPKLLMINYNDCDYVHWGNITHYTRAISIMDDGLRQIVRTVEADPEYRDNTVFVVVPDCGRDSNRAMAVPCQHHFGSRSSHEIFGLLVGPGIDRGRVYDACVDQISIAATIGKLMGFHAKFAEGPVLAEAIA